MPVAAELDLPSRLDLIHLESQLGSIGETYTVEDSSISKVNASFPRIEGKSMIDWIHYFSKKGKVRILEIGGGIHQEAALGILERYKDSDIELVGLEPRQLTDQAKERLSGFKNYHPVGKGISALPDLEGEKFDIIFAHYVIEHLPNPLWAIQQASRLLSPEGVLFCNRALLDRGTLEKFDNLLRQQQVSIAYFYHPDKTEVGLRKKGLVKTDIALRVRNNYPHFQIIEGRTIVDFYGRRLPTRECDLVAC